MITPDDVMYQLLLLQRCEGIGGNFLMPGGVARMAGSLHQASARPQLPLRTFPDAPSCRVVVPKK